ncbi:MAG: 4-hydroxythreonine-4-phosphate dehydrogenase PdxA [Verrucomicrobiota bacterium]
MIGITLGDVTGIGPEVALKALAAEVNADSTRYLLLGDFPGLQRLNLQLGLNLPLQEGLPDTQTTGRFFVHNPLSAALPLDLKAGDSEAARAAVAWLNDAAQRCRRGEIAAMVTAPVNKEAINRAGIPFVGQTELLTQFSGTDRTAMMLLGADDRGRWLRVALVTTHIAMQKLAAAITRTKVELAIELAAQACRDLGLPRAKVGVCGLNPHAGEGGEFGTEEITTIRPAVDAVRARGVDAEGPFAADTLFYYVYRGDYDAVVAMYHDQGLAPLKMVAFEGGINWTLGLPFIRTSPDHGTAYNIAGRGVANAYSMVAALRLAKQLANQKH